MAAPTDKKTPVSELDFTSKSHKVGLGYRVQFAMYAGEFGATWTPCTPTGRDARRCADKYYAARDQFLSEVARRTGDTVACVELPA